MYVPLTLMYYDITVFAVYQNYAIIVMAAYNHITTGIEGCEAFARHVGGITVDTDGHDRFASIIYRCMSCVLSCNV